jgi:hypothetical protein
MGLKLKADKSDAYQLDSSNDWKLLHLDGNEYRLVARYEHQSLVDSIALVVKWHFQLDGWITRDGNPAPYSDLQL